MTRHLIIGAGEIGTSFYNLLKDFTDVQIRDRESDITGQFDYLHVAFPAFDQKSFVETVNNYVTMYQPQTLVVYSTVPVGTIRALGEWAVHVPVRGKHPHLEQSIKTFRLYVGGNDPVRVAEVAKLLGQFAADVYPLNPAQHPPETTELLKLLDTTYLGWTVLFEKEAHRLCQQYGIDFEVVYTDANKTYNTGYSALGDSQFVRPVLKHFPGKIGGHCVVPNCKLLSESYIPQLIIEKNREFEQTNE